MKNKPVINVQHLRKSFGTKVAVADFDLNLNEGEICGFLGPNGSGKTTTLRMLCGLLIPDRGQGSCLGYDILTESYQIKRQVGYMTQQFSLYTEMTVSENLYFVAQIYAIPQPKKKIEAALEQFDLLAYRHQLVANLSGGLKQRLALTACLLHDPKLLLLDEPTAGVDPKTRREFWDQIFKLSNQGITTLVSTHYMDEAERCTRLVYISQGHLLATGTATELITHSKLYTWRVSGEHLNNLAENLLKRDDIDQVAFFGDKLHVSGKDEIKLMNIAEQFKSQYHWEKISPDLEDVFIHLVTKAKEKS